MAGSYNDIPYNKMAYDGDGSVVLYETGDGSPYPGAYGAPAHPWVLASGTVMNGLNDENEYSGIKHWANYGHITTCVLFPEKRDIDAIYLACATQSRNETMGYSSDTTNGIDGNWADLGITPYRRNWTHTWQHRQYVSPVSFDGVLAIRIATRGGIAYESAVYMRSLNIYGTIMAGKTPDRIIFLDTEDADAEFTKVLDFGDVYRGGTGIRQFKLKNNSNIKTITSLQLTAEDTFLNAGNWYTFSKNGVDYQGTLNTIGDLTPGEVLPVWAKYVVPDNETLGPQTARFKVSHTDVT